MALFHKIANICALAILLLFAGITTSEVCNTHSVPNPSPKADLRSPNLYSVLFHTNIVLDGSTVHQSFIMNVTRIWAPKGSDRFYSLVKDNYFSNATFFRLVPDFVVQFGIAAQKRESAKWISAIKDDPVSASNLKWSVSFATSGPDTRSTQIFINYADNTMLDYQGFAPFGEVVSGFDALLAINNPSPSDSGGIDQDMMYERGNEWVVSRYPTVNYVTCASVVFEDNVNSQFESSKNGNKQGILSSVIIAVMIILGLIMLTAVCYNQFCSKYCVKKPLSEEEEYAKKAFEMSRL